VSENDLDDYKLLQAQKRFLGEIEQGIRLANRELIHKKIPELNKDSILSFAVAVGRLRATYLEMAVNMSVGEHGDPPDQSYIDELHRKRQMFEEARIAFEALRDAIEKGYIDVEDLQ
jgi:hypothetical protein